MPSVKASLSKVDVMRSSVHYVVQIQLVLLYHPSNIISTHLSWQMCSLTVEWYSSPADQSYEHRDQGLDRLSMRTSLLMVEPGQPQASECQAICLTSTPGLFCLKVLKSEVNFCPSSSYCSSSVSLLRIGRTVCSRTLQSSSKLSMNPSSSTHQLCGLYRMLHLSEPQFLHLQNEGNNDTPQRCEN